MRIPKQWILGAAVAAALGVTPAAQAGGLNIFRGQSTEEAARPTNTQTAQAVATALKGAGLSGRDIEIEVDRGTAVLKGQIADAAQKARATQVVSAVDGIKSVDNQMQPMQAAPVMQAGFNGNAAGGVRTVSHESGPSNQQVAQAIGGRLSQAGLAKYEMEIRYKDGVASLAGEVGSAAEVAQAQQLTASVPGVQRVVNSLTVGGQPAAGGVRQTAFAAPPLPAPAGYPQMPTQGGLPPQGMPGNHGPLPGQMMQPGQMMRPGQMMQGGVQPASHMMAPGCPTGAAGGLGASPVYNNPNLPDYAWPAYAAPDNYAQVNYPSQYDASAWPYIGPFYPYPQVPLGWRSAQLDWDDGYWKLRFAPKTDKWWWFVNPSNWH